MTIPLTREKQIELMVGTESRREATFRRIMADPKVRESMDRQTIRSLMSEIRRYRSALLDCLESASAPGGEDGCDAIIRIVVDTLGIRLSPEGNDIPAVKS